MNEQVKAALEDVDQAIEDALHLVERLADEIGRGTGGREVALVKTKLEEAHHWSGAAGQAFLSSEGS